MEEQLGEKKTILIVEDDNVLRETLARHLKPMFNIIEAGSGEKGLQDIYQSKPDAVVLDLLLPNLNGFDLLEQVRHHPDPVISATKVVILSNFTQSADILKAKGLEVSSYLVKANTSLNDLSAKIKEALKGIIM